MAACRPANHKEKTSLSHSINLAPVRRQPWGHNVTCKSQIKLNCPELPGVKTPSHQSCLPMSPLCKKKKKKKRIKKIQTDRQSADRCPGVTGVKVVEWSICPLVGHVWHYACISCQGASAAAGPAPNPSTPQPLHLETFRPWLMTEWFLEVYKNTLCQNKKKKKENAKK